MRELLILRHAKSDWASAVEGDFGRPLTKKGEAAAERVGHFITKAGLVPDLVLTSSAARARTTAEKAAKAGQWESRIEISDALYDTVPVEVERLLALQPDHLQRILLIGHNPTWEQLVSRFIGGGRITMSTAALAVIQLQVLSWKDISFGTGALQLLVNPKIIKKAAVP